MVKVFELVADEHDQGRARSLTSEMMSRSAVLGIHAFIFHGKLLRDSIDQVKSNTRKDVGNINQPLDLCSIHVLTSKIIPCVHFILCVVLSSL